ncbi:MAG: nucleotidyltransferase domain-containing protein [Gaiellaceae bacterium]
MIGVEAMRPVADRREAGDSERRVETALERAVLRTIAYADVFDHALSAGDVHRYLVGAAASPGAVSAELRRLAHERLTEREGLYVRSGRSELFDTRRTRADGAARLWPQAVRYGRVLAQLPFVRMVAVTGSLARDNADPHGDIDYLVVTEAGQVWVVRGLTGLVRRLARRRGISLCINYILSEEALSLPDRDLFTAHELVQMVPLTGHRLYGRLRLLNEWTAEFLPNAEGRPRTLAPLTPSRRRIVALVEAGLRTAIGAWLGRLEQARFERKLPRRAPAAREVVYSADCFKDHVDGWGERVLAAYAERLAAGAAEA